MTKQQKLDRIRRDTMIDEVMRTVRLHRQDRTVEDQDQFLRWELERLFVDADSRVDLIENQTNLLLAEHKRPGSGWTAGMASVYRAREISSSYGLGYGCDVCREAGVKTLGVLRIGWYKIRLQIDLCRKCWERLAAVADARLEDKRGLTVMKGTSNGEAKRG